jgi:hypothetical protein
VKGDGRRRVRLGIASSGVQSDFGARGFGPPGDENAVTSHVTIGRVQEVPLWKWKV